MKRILKIKLDLEKGVQFSEEKIFTQGDLNTHFLNIILPEELDLTDKTMQINFIKPNKEVIFEIIDTLSQENEIKISNNALDTPGKVLLEIILKKSDTEILTINKLAYFIVTETISGANIEVEPGINTVSFITEKLSQLSESLSKIRVTKTEVNNATTEFNTLNNLAIKTKEDLVSKNKIALETTTNLNLLNGSALVTKESLNTLNIQAIQNKKDLEEYIQTEKDKLKGERGIQGIQGPKGEKGNAGLKGDIGPIGPQGIQGIKGSTGIQGIKGIQGDKGEQGIQGIKGEKGVQGLKGNKGDRGEQGIQGPNGKDSEIVFNTKAGTVLEGSKLAETLGIPYGGILNNSNSKVAGTAYYDNTTKKTYKCTSTTPLNYAESTKFEPISNNDLLLKFQNFKVFGNKMSNNLYSTNRKSNVEYTNISSIFRLVYFRGNNHPSNGSFLVYIDGQNVCSFDGYGPSNVGGFFIVPPGSKYKIYANGVALEYWYEY